MLQRLTVRNLAIVEDLELDFSPGLTVVTGETGAGKSLLVDAVQLLAGGRGSADLVRPGAERLSVSGEFAADGSARAILEEAGLPARSATILIRRELSPDGRGRAFIEDEPATVRTLARLGERLVAIQGQNSEQELSQRQAPLELLDAFADAEKEREETARSAAAWRAARDAVLDLEQSRRDRGARLEELDYQIRELEDAAPGPTEENDLAADRQRLLHEDRIRRAGEAALAALLEAEGSAADRLGEAARAFAELASIDPREQPNLEEAQEIKRRVADLAAAARDGAARVESDPERLNSVEHRLEKLARLKRKHGLSTGELPALLERLKAEQDELANFEDALGRRRREEEAAGDRYRRAAAALSGKRAAAAPRFSAAIEKELKALAMEKARFRVSLTTGEEAPRPLGLESASFLFAPNPGEPEKPVEKIASGGELSRLELAVRSVAAGRVRGGRTLVFDEVDAGIGGRTAEVVGKKLRLLARHDQVLCVTHVPQIAALAHRHFRAEKAGRGGRTVAVIKELSGKDRVAEIARMLAGEKIPETAMKHAQALLDEAGN
jgi:DNA repair protein RecN (Recombination protein N)